MKLEALAGRYDKVVSLGAACQVAAQMKRHGLRDASGPVDWFVFEHIPALVETLKSKFSHFMELENLTPDGLHEGKWKLMDTETGCVSIHDFPGDAPYQETYPIFQARLKRRVERCYQDIQKAERVLFIRVHGSYQDTRMLRDCLEELFGDKFVLLVVNHIEEEKICVKDWDIPNVCAVDILQRDGEWDGFNPHWDSILKGVSLIKRPPAVKEIMEYEHWYPWEEDQSGKFRWSEGKAFLTIHNHDRRTLCFSVRTYKPGGVPLQIKEGSQVLFSGLISPEPVLIRLDITDEYFRIMFDVDAEGEGAWAPDAVFHNGDQRRLGVALSNVSII